MDCGGEIGNAAKYNRFLAEKKHLSYMGTAQIVMPENYIAMFSAPQAEEAKEIVKKAEPHIADAISHIKAGKTFIVPQNKLHDRFMSGPVNPVFYRFFVKAAAFQAKDTCIGCGKCVMKCPHCMACICYCPTEAVDYGKKSIGKPRYHFEQLEMK